MIQKHFLFFFIFLFISILFVPSTTRKLSGESKGSVHGSTSGHAPSAVGNRAPGTATRGRGRPMSYSALVRQKPFCNATIYGNCTGGPSKFYRSRPQAYNNQTRRP